MRAAEEGVGGEDGVEGNAHFGGEDEMGWHGR